MLTSVMILTLLPLITLLCTSLPLHCSLHHLSPCSHTYTELLVSTKLNTSSNKIFCFEWLCQIKSLLLSLQLQNKLDYIYFQLPTYTPFRFMNYPCWTLLLSANNALSPHFNISDATSSMPGSFLSFKTSSNRIKATKHLLNCTNTEC